MKTSLISTVIVAVALVGVGTLGFRAMRAESHEPVIPVKPAAVRAMQLQQRNYAITESFYGRIEAFARVDMAFQISGRVIQLGGNDKTRLVEDDMVKKGDVIARIDPVRYEAAMRRAEARINEARAMQDQIQAEVDRAEAELKDAKSEIERINRLRQQGAANQREVEKTELAVTLAEAQLNRIRAQLESAAASYKSAMSEAEMASVNVQDATLLAPMDARVAVIPVEIGSMVQPSQPIISLVDISRVKLVIGVVERKLPLLRPGLRVNVVVDALTMHADKLSNHSELAKPHQGIITVVPPAADPVTGLFNVEIEIPNEQRWLKPGMIAKAQVTVIERVAFALPAEATIRSGERIFAFFVREGYAAGLDMGEVGRADVNVPLQTAHRVQVTPDATDKDYLLLNKLPDGMDRVIVEGQSRLVDGQPIKVVDGLTSAASQ